LVAAAIKKLGIPDAAQCGSIVVCSRPYRTDFGMKKHAAFVLKRSVAGLLVIAPVYLAG